MSLLLDERPVVLQPSLVRELGIAEAAISQQLHYWAQRATHEHDGHWWVAKTYQDWSDEIGITAKVARNACDRLRKAGVLVAIANPDDPHNRTQWWRLDYAKLPDNGAAPGRSKCPSGQIEVPQRADPPRASDLQVQRVPPQKGSLRSPSARTRARGGVLISGKPVKPEAWELTETVLAEFNRQTSSKLRLRKSSGEPSEAAKRIYGRVAAYPDITFAEHQDIIRRTLSSRWWGTDRPSIGVVYGPKVFEDNITRSATPTKQTKDAEKAARDERRMAAMARVQQQRAEATR